MFMIRNVRIDDLSELVVIEQLCFVKEEAAPKEAFEKRIQFISDSFFIAEGDGKIMGFVNGPVIEEPYITDELFSDVRANPISGGHQSILGIAVSPGFQGRGVATALLAHLEEEAKLKNRETITLTCKEKLIPFYERHGYHNQGVSTSNHGGAVWYDLVKKLY
ncbi:GNAT family N-acetyltransferase [Neobacillus rhizosphaerae]|uniref:GNAT family N-acetyltransferase n=1 Tax=Neobacillus rhizosphaerae TaxID=2880965 RepID=UPI003D2CC217